VNSGEMDMSLMGMSFLSRFRLTLDGETMTLER
jgi:predicted aspartyl protease